MREDTASVPLSYYQPCASNPHFRPELPVALSGTDPPLPGRPTRWVWVTALSIFGERPGMRSRKHQAHARVHGRTAEADEPRPALDLPTGGVVPLRTSRRDGDRHDNPSRVEDVHDLVLTWWIQVGRPVDHVPAGWSRMNSTRTSRQSNACDVLRQNTHQLISFLPPA